MKTNEIISELKQARDNALYPILCAGDFVLLTPELLDAAIERLESLEKEQEACFRLGQMDMKESVTVILREAANNTFGIARSTLRSAADAVAGLETEP